VTSTHQAEFNSFYEQILDLARARGISCAITSGMACIAHGVATATKDCDVLCDPSAAAEFLELIGAVRFHDVAAEYRGHLGAPLDTRWQHGGWTSHFCWKTEGGDAFLDIFGVAPRASAPWNTELAGLYAGPQLVAEMKRTDRPKDWPFVTALGVKLLRNGDVRGWLHIFDHQVMLELAREIPCPPDLITRRPVLELLPTRDPRLDIALRGEMEFWQQLDHLRMQVYRQAVRAYVFAVKRDSRSDNLDLPMQHQARVEHAERLLPTSPLRDFGIDRLVAEARKSAERMAPQGSLEWLPDVSGNFFGLG
jgi:hypothetical protein